MKHAPDYERVEPNSEMVELTKIVLAQNERIIEGNFAIIQRISSPLTIVKGDNPIQ